jgi:hypothetical protein
MEARPGWVDEAGHAEGAIPGFGWTAMTGIRETSIDPQKDVPVKWADATFSGINFAEHFTIVDQNARVLAQFADGTPAAYEHAFGKGSAILLGTFAGQANEAKPVAMHPLGGILQKWAGLSVPNLKAPTLVELREMDSRNGHLVFLFNHGEQPAQVRFTEDLERPAASVHEIISEEKHKTEGTRFTLKTDVPAESVKIYRIDY